MSNDSMNIEAEIQTLLKEIGPGKMSSTAYDTAWVARLGSIDWELSSRSLGWICDNQLSDGSWGAKDVFYYHDRVICTLAAMIALTHRGRRAFDKTQIEKGLMALERITSGATQGLAADPNGSTIGFEMIAPTLVADAEKLGIIKQQGNRILGRLGQLRNAKMEKLAGRKINRFVTPAFSSEMAGLDGQAMLDVENLQEKNGSVGHSPSATAYFATYLKPGDTEALAYLHHWATPDGGIPDDDPFDVFEPAWALWNLRLVPTLDTQILELCQPHLDSLEKNWDANTGIAHALEYTPKDSDDSALTFELLTLFGRNVDIQGVLSYEELEHFRCFALEANPSISANIHVLGALRAGGFESKHPAVQKILKYLRKTLISSSFWADKWHISPYYATAHAIILAHKYDPVMCQNAVEWMLKNQRTDGAWGTYQSTAEETAYAIQALCIWKRAGGKISGERIEKATNWLINKIEPPYPPLWIGKALYCPELVVRSAILSAIYLGKQTL
jgi:halimadienyl-diphosphate synthase